MSYKQVILVRQDLKLPKGKLSVQVAHASTEALISADKKKVRLWRMEGGKKVVLKVANEKELLRYEKLAKDLMLNYALIKDAGKTFLEPGTITSLAIGPDDEEKIDKISGKLKML